MRTYGDCEAPPLGGRSDSLKFESYPPSPFYRNFGTEMQAVIGLCWLEVIAAHESIGVG